MLGTLADLLGNANGQTPVVLIVATGLLIVAAWIGRRVFGSIQRQGKRLGDVEQLLRSERIRRRQTEQVVREHGIRLPYWPGDPAELQYAVPVGDVDDVVDVPETRFITEQERAQFARHRR